MEKLYDGELLNEQFYGEMNDVIENLGNSDSFQPDPENEDRAEATTATLSKTSFDELSGILAFDYDTLPSAAAAFVRDTSTRLNCPPEFIAISLLIAVSALIDSRIQICPMENDKTLEVVPVFKGIAVAPSSRKKCPKLKAALRPLYDQKSSEREKVQSVPQPIEESVYDFRRLVIESSHQFSKGKIKRVAKNGDGDIESISRLENKFLHANQSAEGENLSLMASVLEADLSAILGKNQNAEQLGQFQLAVYPDICEWRHFDKQPDREVVKLIAVIFARLDKWIKNQGKLPIVLDFSEDAQILFFRWWENHEEMLKETGAHQGLLDHLDQFRDLFPALALVFFLIDAMANNENLTPECTVDLTPAERAAGFCQLLDGHARRIYGIALRPEVADAKMILKKISEGRLTSGFAKREIYINNLGGIKTSARAGKALALLVEHNYLRVEYVKLSNDSIKLAERYFVN